MLGCVRFLGKVHILCSCCEVLAHQILIGLGQFESLSHENPIGILQFGHVLVPTSLLPLSLGQQLVQFLGHLGLSSSFQTQSQFQLVGSAPLGAQVG